MSHQQLGHMEMGPRLEKQWIDLAIPGFVFQRRKGGKAANKCFSLQQRHPLCDSFSCSHLYYNWTGVSGFAVIT